MLKLLPILISPKIWDFFLSIDRIDNGLLLETKFFYKTVKSGVQKDSIAEKMHTWGWYPTNTTRWWATTKPLLWSKIKPNKQAKNCQRSIYIGNTFVINIWISKGDFCTLDLYYLCSKKYKLSSLKFNYNDNLFNFIQSF